MLVILGLGEDLRFRDSKLDFLEDYKFVFNFSDVVVAFLLISSWHLFSSGLHIPNWVPNRYTIYISFLD